MRDDFYNFLKYFSKIYETKDSHKKVDVNA
jgi:hypothetical protein